MDIDQELDELLKTRYVPDMRSNLEYRITKASLQQSREEKYEGGLFKILRAFSDYIVLPQPVLTMTIVLICGALIGGYSADTSMSDYDIDVETFVMMTDDIEYGDFL